MRVRDRSVSWVVHASDAIETRLSAAAGHPIPSPVDQRPWIHGTIRAWGLGERRVLACGQGLLGCLLTSWPSVAEAEPKDTAAMKPTAHLLRRDALVMCTQY